jgi:hypothetical protein
MRDHLLHIVDKGLTGSDVRTELRAWADKHRIPV